MADTSTWSAKRIAASEAGARQDDASEVTVVHNDLAVTVRRQGDGRLGRTLVAIDSLALVVAWTGSALLSAALLGELGPSAAMVRAALGIGVGLVLLAALRLYRSQVCAVPAEEYARIGRVTTLSTLTVGMFVLATDGATPFAVALTAMPPNFVLLVAGRAYYRSRLRDRRRRGLNTRPVALIGTNAEARELAKVIAEHPEAGLTLAGAFGEQGGADAMGTVFLGAVDQAPDRLERHGIHDVIVASSAIADGAVNELAHRLLNAGVYVRLSTGLRGIAHSRLRAVPVGREPLFLLAPVALSRWQLRAKRALDVVIAAVGLVVAAPVLAVCALAVVVDDGRPVLFRQNRVGREGGSFEMWKLRTMVTGAERRRAELTAANMRSGPLFKLSADPRVTTVGRVLRAFSLDELPQLVNVLRGDMSIVGPRPALPEEFEAFDDRLRQRSRVPPGVTGLWQVEARDNPAFGAYRRLDLYYVDNWSITLDLAIIAATVTHVAGRAVKAVAHGLRRVEQEAHPPVLE